VLQFERRKVEHHLSENHERCNTYQGIAESEWAGVPAQRDYIHKTARGCSKYPMRENESIYNLFVTTVVGDSELRIGSLVVDRALRKREGLEHIRWLNDWPQSSASRQIFKLQVRHGILRVRVNAAHHVTCQWVVPLGNLGVPVKLGFAKPLWPSKKMAKGEPGIVLLW
jgi:hypothetical protein